MSSTSILDSCMYPPKASEPHVYIKQATETENLDLSESSEDNCGARSAWLGSSFAGTHLARGEFCWLRL